MNWTGTLNFTPPPKKDEPKRPAPRRRTTSRKVTIDGKDYPSISQAAQALGISVRTVYHRMGEWWR